MQTELKKYFESGSVVCPYARIVQKEFFTDIDIVNNFGHWVTVLLARNACIIMASEDVRNYDQARVWCCETFTTLCSRIPYAEAVFPSPFLHIGGLVAYTIGMGPQYPKDHVRYAPQLCLVSVNEAAIREVPFDKRIPIRKEMTQRMSVAYDADNIWLAIRPQGRT